MPFIPRQLLYSERCRQLTYLRSKNTKKLLQTNLKSVYYICTL